MEREDYESALDFVECDKSHWTPDLLRGIVKGYWNHGRQRPEQKVTVAGVPSDISQEKAVEFWDRDGEGCVGEIIYDLNIDGEATDLTAQFDLIAVDKGWVVELRDIQVL